MPRFHPSCSYRQPLSVMASAVEIVPCSLVFLDEQASGSPNSRGHEPLSYIAQAVTLNRSLLAAGLPRLTVMTNASSVVDDYLSRLTAEWRPMVRRLQSSLVLSKETSFYAAHFKIDLLEQMAASLSEEQLLLLLDTDVIARHGPGVELLRRCRAAGVGVFDITDQEFSAYGAKRVVADLERVAGRTLDNPRWFGGECLLATRSFIEQLTPLARDCFSRYRDLIPELNHQGDEVFISAAINILADEGHALFEIGAHRAVGRHWSGNTHRDLRWFKECAFLHLPDRKADLAKLAARPTFSAARVWQGVVVRHQINRIVWFLRLHFRKHRHHRRMATLADVLLIDSDSIRLSSLARPLTSRGLVVMCVGPDGANEVVQRIRPKVVVVGSPLSLVQIAGLSSEVEHRLVFVASSVDQAQVHAATWSRFYQQITDVPVMVDAISEAVEQAGSDGV
jgi:hypothetical protein